jgi:hypothetical protein
VIARLAPLAGLAGTIVMGLASLVTALAYTGTKGEPGLLDGPAVQGEPLRAPDSRPAFWWVTTLEWASIVALRLWVSLTSTTWLRYREARGAHPAA